MSVLHNVKKNEALKKQSLVLRMDLQFSQRCIINCELSFWNKIENCPFLRKMQSINICLILCKSEWGKRKKKRMNIWINIETFQQVPIKSLSAVQWGKMENFLLYAQNKLLPGLFNWNSFLESSKGSLFLFSAFLHQSKHMKIDYILLFTNMMLQGLKMNKNFL